MMLLGVLSVSHGNGFRLLAAVDRVATRDAVLENEEERGGEAVPLVRVPAALHHQVLVLLQSARAAQAEDEAQQEEQEHED